MGVCESQIYKNQLPAQPGVSLAQTGIAGHTTKLPRGAAVQAY